ncbi:IS1595 family transposase [Thauera aromatica K172]|uniref:IS1595 family transposase n=1 Tax=Thauera aromatica K172 TaxID=44139 RepID=A0A2R4BS06_THAAR|nr:IS1595 family transposase [Thauera aromatica K172]
MAGHGRRAYTVCTYSISGERWSHGNEPNPVSTRPVDARVSQALRDRSAVRGGVGAGALAAGVSVPELRWGRLQPGARANPRAVPVPGLSASDLADRGHRDAGHEIGPDRVVPRDLPHQPSQDRSVGARPQAAPGGELPDRLADPPQADAGDGRTRAALCPRRPGPDR